VESALVNIVMLCGGVGGARAALALYENFTSHSLTFVVNSGDDFSHLGLEVWPDWDTVFYHLGGLHDTQRGWGRADEGTRAMDEFQRFGGPDWFHLGDRDLALHVYRSWLLGEGWSRGRLADHLTQRVELSCRVLPVTDCSLQTRLHLADGRTMEFQPWFVQEQGRPTVRQIEADSTARVLPEVLNSLMAADLVVMAPSNPYLSLGPMLALPELAGVLNKLNIPKLAISPLVGGKAIKGPLDRLIASLSDFEGQQAIAEYWAPWVDGLVLPEDEAALLDTPIKLLGGPTMLTSATQRSAFCEALRRAWQAL
jgi:LPPG:FO 2-phospho-L-lactate transferase